MLFEKKILCSFVQGMTEMLPISSGYHLSLLGVHEYNSLHLATGIATMIYAVFFQQRALLTLLRSMRQALHSGWYYSRSIVWTFIGSILCILFSILINALLQEYPTASSDLASNLLRISNLVLMFLEQLVSFQEQLMFLPFTLLIIRYLKKTVVRKSLRRSLLILLGFILWNFIHVLRGYFSVLFWEYQKSPAVYGAAVLAINGLILLCLEAQDLARERAIQDYTVQDLIWSILGNCIGLIPGASRLGSVYTVLRIRGFTSRSSLILGSIQSIFIIPITIGGWKELAGTESIICSLLHFMMIYIIFSLRSRGVSRFITICGIYRVLFGSYLIRSQLIHEFYHKFLDTIHVLDSSKVKDSMQTLKQRLDMINEDKELLKAMSDLERVRSQSLQALNLMKS